MIVPGQYLELVRLSQLSIITNILTQWHTSTTRYASPSWCVLPWSQSPDLSPGGIHQPRLDTSFVGVQSQGGNAGGEETVKWLEGDGTRPFGVSRSSSPGTFHLSPATAHSSQSLNNSIIVAAQWLHWNWTNLYECNQKLELCTSYI